MTTADHPRRTCLTVPGSSERFLAKAVGLAADEMILDLEDSVAPGAKEQARQLVAAALDDGWPGRSLLAVRINAATSPWAYRDVIEIMERAGARLDAVVLPKVTGPGPVIWLDVLLSQVELAAGLPPGRIRIEAQIEPGNHASQAVCRSLGFAEEGTLRAWYRIGDQNRDMILFARLLPPYGPPP